MCQRYVALILLAACQSVSAASLFTFAADNFGAPTALNRMDPASSSSVTNIVMPLGDGNTGYDGGIVAMDDLLFAVGNDSSGDASIYSFTDSGTNLTLVSSDFNTAGDAAGFVFSDGLAAIGNTLYAIGQGAAGEDLFQIGHGTATLVSPLSTLNGTYAGLAYDATLGIFYAVIANASDPSCNGDCLVKFGLAGNVTTIAQLNPLDGTEAGTHLGGLADAGGGILYDLYTNVNDGNGELEQISLIGPPSATTLYETNIPLAQNAGIALVTPEPALGAVTLAACAFFLLKSRGRFRRPGC